MAEVTRGGKICLAGAVMGVAGAAVLATSGTFPPSLARLQADPSPTALLAAGIAVLVVGCFVYVLRPERPHVVATVRTAVAMFVVALVLAQILTIPLALRGRPVALGPLALVYAIVASEVPIIFVVWVRLVAPGCLSWRGLGLKPRPLADHIVTGLAGGIMLFVAAGVVSAALARAGVRQNQSAQFSGVEGAPPGLFVLAMLAGCVLAPFAEELFFRGYIFQTFLRERGPLPAYLFSAGLFALVHANAAALAPIFVLGLLLCWIFRRTGSAVPGMIAHGLNNAIAFGLLYATGR